MYGIQFHLSIFFFHEITLKKMPHNMQLFQFKVKFSYYYLIFNILHHSYANFYQNFQPTCEQIERDYCILNIIF